ncbi:MAG TPA: HAD family hydrolase [Polyangia bacterium]|jgi:HAD superfamily hydrolase (TIGR01509 family)|nr:HAD family hydrolase [Polyangia bacterium]
MAPRGVIFDLDGTLTEPLLDFEAIRRELGLPTGVPILEALAPLDVVARERAEVILRRHELAAIAAATLADGCVELLALLQARATPTAILTRNVRAAVDDFVARFGFRFSAIYTREDGPPKPSPHGALALCRAMGVDPRDVWGVGDYKFDVIAARDAGCRTVLVCAEPPPDLTEWGSPDLVVRSLRELIGHWT